MSAVLHVLRQMSRDPRLAYLLGPGSQSFELLTQEQAEAEKKDIRAFRASFEHDLRTERVYTASDVARLLELPEEDVRDRLSS